MDTFSIGLLAVVVIGRYASKYIRKDYEKILKDAHKKAMRRYEINMLRWDIN